MAIADIVPSRLSQITLTVEGGLQRFVLGPIRDISGAAVDLSAFDTLEMTFWAGAFGSSSANIAIVPTVTGNADGTVTVDFSNTNANDMLNRGGQTISYRLRGKPTSGDAMQMLGYGNLVAQK